MSRKSSAKSDRSRPNSSTKASCSVEVKIIEQAPIRASSALIVNNILSIGRPLSSRKISKYQVVVIGAGICGLSACVKLIENGIKDILILEASDRIGGRINTIPFQNSFIEIGAQWIHGTEGNPIYELSNSIGNIDKSEGDNETMLYATQDGKEIDEKLIEKIIEKIHEATENIRNEVSESDLDKSLGGLMSIEIEKLIDEFGSEIEPELIRAVYVSEMSNERYESSCEDLNNLSAFGWNSFEDFEGDNFTKQKQGYIKIIEYLKSKLSDNVFKLNEPVVEINWSDIDNQIIKITTGNGQVYEANKVISTIPLGFLKAHHKALFKPNLPQDKVMSIENLGFGCIDKIFIAFERPLTDLGFGGLQIFYRNDIHLNLIENSIRKWNLKDDGFYKELTEFEILPNHSNVLFGFACGASAVYIESLQDECLIEIFHELFSKCFPQLKLPKIKTILRSKWNSNPNTKGSYTYIKAGTSPKIIDSLAKPIRDCLYFAGESTTSAYTGTVHGAYISGQNTANLISESLEN